MSQSQLTGEAMSVRFHQAVREGNIEVVERLLALGADGNEPDWQNNGHVALLEASRVQNVPMVQALLGGGCSPNARDCQGQTALHVAVKNRVPNTALVNALLSAGANPTLSDTVSGMTPLHVLTNQATNCKSHVERAMFVHVLRALLDLCDVDGATHSGDTALHLAAKGPSVAVAKVLLDAKANCDVQNARGETPLMVAIVNNQVHIAKAIIEIDCDVNVRDRYNQTALHYVANNNSLAILEALLSSRKCDINATDLNNDTALHMAAGKGHGAIIKALLTSPDILPHLVNVDGKTAAAIVEEGNFSHLLKLFPLSEDEEKVIYRHPEKLYRSSMHLNDNPMLLNGFA